jgi:hypothetical protein
LKYDLLSDLDLPEVSFNGLITKYFSKYGALLFDRCQEFWRVFVDAMTTILASEKSDILNAIDHLAVQLLYDPDAKHFPGGDDGYSDSLTQLMDSPTFARIDRSPIPVAIYRAPDDTVRTPIPLDDGQFICELPGFIVHTDEVECAQGLSRSVVSITDSEIACATTFELAPIIRRSFHFNSVIRLVRMAGDPTVALFATRPRGPLGEEKGRRAIAEDGEIVLPFDGSLPFEVEKVEWKDRKQRQKVEPEKKAPFVELSLLSAFLFDVVPPVPIVLLPDRKAVEKYLGGRENRKRNKRNRGRSD